MTTKLGWVAESKVPKAWRAGAGVSAEARAAAERAIESFLRASHVEAARDAAVIHARHEYRGKDLAPVHPCGVAYVRNVTLEPGPSGISDATGEYVASKAVTCPGCLAEAKRHSEACAAVRR